MTGQRPAEGSPTLDLGELGTESANPRTADLDTMSTVDLLTVMNAEDRTVPLAVARALPDIARAVDLIVAARRHQGRLVYLGAGTSGRLGLLDAVECPPTFGTDPGEVVGLIAGGDGAFRQAVEGAEDDARQAEADLDALGLQPSDVVVGIAASGRTPYVIGGLLHAGVLGAATVSLACNRQAPISRIADVAIEIETGPEIVTGSTRLKAGTAQKLVCNMLSTASMVATGKVYRNLMVDVQPTNAKLVDRSIRIVAAAAEVDLATAIDALHDAGGNVKTAIVMLLAGCTMQEARDRLTRDDGRVRQAVHPRRNLMTTWLITGCSTGLGRAFAEAVLARGDNAVVTARDAAKVTDLADAHPDTALALALDVTDDAQVTAAVEAAEERFGGVDVLVNNAGYGYRSAIEEGGDDDVHQLFDTHVFGTVRTIKAVLPGMRARRSGTIVNLSSIGARISPEGSGYYAAVKAAIEALTLSLRKEVAPLGITAMVVEPGGFRTDFAGRSLTQSAEPIADYAETAGKRRKEHDTVHGTQKGDPAKAASVLIEAVESDHPPFMLLLGNDASDGFRAALDALRTEIDTWESLSRSTDFDD